MITTFLIQYLYLTNSLYNKHGIYCSLPRSSILNKDLLLHVNPYKTLKNVHTKIPTWQVITSGIQILNKPSFWMKKLFPVCKWFRLWTFYPDFKHFGCQNPVKNLKSIQNFVCTFFGTRGYQKSRFFVDYTC